MAVERRASMANCTFFRRVATFSSRSQIAIRGWPQTWWTSFNRSYLDGDRWAPFSPLSSGVDAFDLSFPHQRWTIPLALGREPIRDFPESKGHGRAGSGQAPKPTIGVLQIEAVNAMSEDDLIKKLIAMGKDQGLAYVYLVETLGGVSR